VSDHLDRHVDDAVRSMSGWPTQRADGYSRARMAGVALAAFAVGAAVVLLIAAVVTR